MWRCQTNLSVVFGPAKSTQELLRFLKLRTVYAFLVLQGLANTTYTKDQHPAMHRFVRDSGLLMQDVCHLYLLCGPRQQQKNPARRGLCWARPEFVAGSAQRPWGHGR